MTMLKITCMHCGKVMGYKEGYGVSGVTSTVCRPCITIHYPILKEAINEAEKAEIEQKGAVEIYRAVDVSLDVYGGNS
jgi:hypothetical protein